MRVSAEERAWLKTACPYFQAGYLDYLATFALRPADEVHVRFVPTQPGAERGELEVFVTGAWARVILYEVPVMAIISETYFAMIDTDWDGHDQRQRAKHKGCTLLQHGVALSEFGTRRRRSFATHYDVLQGLVDAQKETPSGRLLGTSNVYLAKELGLAPVGTVAHEWTMAIAAIHGYEHSNLRALELWDAVYQPPAFTPQRPGDDLTIALTDTFSTRVFWDDLLSEERGRALVRRWRGVRQDSGDSRAFVDHAVDVYRRIGVDPATKIVIFSDGTHRDSPRPECRAVPGAAGVRGTRGYPGGVRRRHAPHQRLLHRVAAHQSEPCAEHRAQARLDRRAAHGEDQRRAHEEHGRRRGDSVRRGPNAARSSAGSA